MEKASQQKITTTVTNITVSNTPAITTTSIITCTTHTNTDAATVTDSICLSSVLHQSGTNYIS